MSKLKSILKWLVIIVIVLAIALFATIKILSEKRPDELKGENADQMAQSMLEALNKPAWDSLKYLKWEFMRGHKFLLDKQGNNAVVEWEENKVILNLDMVDGKAYQKGVEVTGDVKQKLIQQAWSMWCNDSFWMFAPFKIYDPGTSRKVVKTEDGQKGLMISYESGGVTPGDGYLWILDKNHIPTGYKMWTSIIPVQGMHMSWENWQTLPGGAKVAISHKSSLLSFDMKGVQEGSTPSALGYENDVFQF